MQINSSVMEDIGYCGPQKRDPHQMARDLVSHVWQICEGKNKSEQVIREREGLKKLSEKYPGKGFERILYEEVRFRI